MTPLANAPWQRLIRRLSRAVYHVHEDGWTKVSMDDVEELHWKYEAEKGNK